MLPAGTRCRACHPQVFGDGWTHRQDPGRAPRLDSRTRIWCRSQRPGMGKGLRNCCGGTRGGREGTAMRVYGKLYAFSEAHGTTPPEKRRRRGNDGDSKHPAVTAGEAEAPRAGGGGGLSHHASRHCASAPSATCLRCKDSTARVPQGSCRGGAGVGGSRLWGSRHRAEDSGPGQDRWVGDGPARQVSRMTWEAWPGCPFPEGPRGRGGSAPGTTRIGPWRCCFTRWFAQI